MSSLHESVSRRRAEESAGLACVTVGASQPGLIVAVWSGPSWVLPWSYLVNARFTEPPGEIELCFSSHIVTAEGDNLRRLLDDLALFRIGLLRDLPEDYRSQLPSDEPFIRRLVVRPAPAPVTRSETTATDIKKPSQDT
jgi:hypothetical protein